MSPVPKVNKTKSRKQKPGKSSKTQAVTSQIRTSKPTAPRVQTDGKRITIARSEMIGTLTNAGVTGFAITPLSLSNPGYDVTPSSDILFPWLSGIATRYERYKFHKLKVRLVSGQPSTATGRVYMAFEPDWDDAVPTTKAGLLGLAQNASSNVYGDCSLNLDLSVVNQSFPWRFCVGATRYTGDPRSAFAGYFCFGVDTPTANLVWDIWVEYSIELSEPTSEGLTETLITDNSADVAVVTYGGSNYLSCKMPGSPGGLNLVDTAEVGIITPWHVPATAIQLPRRGAIKYTDVMAKAATTPAAALAAQTMANDLSVYDAKGTLLGYVSNGVAHVLQVIGVQASNKLAVAGENFRAQITFYIADLLAAFVSAMYVLPYTVATADPGITTRQTHIEYMP